MAKMFDVTVSVEITPDEPKGQGNLNVTGFMLGSTNIPLGPSCSAMLRDEIERAAQELAAEEDWGDH